MRRTQAYLLTAVFTASVPLASQGPPSEFVNFEGAQTNPIRMSADGARLFALNTPDARVSVFDLTNPTAPSLIVEIPVGIEPVSVNVNPTNDDEAWVVNQVSDSVSIVSVSQGIVTDTIYCKDEPADIVFAGTNAFVSVARSNLINVYDITSHQLVKSIPVFGENPRAMAVSSDSTKVYAAFALSGNHTTILPSNLAPPQPPPTNPALPPPPHVSLIIDASDPTWSWFIKYTMPDNDVVAIDTSTLTVASYYSGVGTINLGIAVQPNTGNVYVSNTNARNLINFEPNLRGHWIDSRITAVQSSGRVTAYDLNPGIDYTVLPNPAALSTALSQPAAMRFDPSGKWLWVVAFGTDRLAKVSATGQILAIVEIGPATGSQVNPATKRGPRGLAINAKRKLLYTLNRLSNTISVVSATSNSVLEEIPTGTFDPTPTAIMAGRGFLYDAKLSGNGTGSCASCHVDADMDLLAWNLGDPGGSMQTVVNNGHTLKMHPMKGPFTTRTLRGLVGTDPLHWRGDEPDFAAFNQAFDLLMGGNQLSDSDMSAYTSYIDTIAFQPNPNQNLDRTYSTSLNGGNAVNGQNAFINIAINTTPTKTCNSCHNSNPGPGSNLNIINRANLPQPIKVPTLRNIYQKLNFSNAGGSSSIDGFGLDGDGTKSNLVQLLAEPVLGGFTNNPQTQLDVAAFVVSFDTGTAPAVGYTRTVTSANATADPTIATDWALLQGQATAGNIDLVCQGTIQGQLHGCLYQPSTNNYETDTTGLGPFTQAQLIGFIQAGDTLSVMGVPPGSGVRFGIDRNRDGIKDGDQRVRSVRKPRH
jgi:DNA-binding beta-propeller fold protein YncE